MEGDKFDKPKSQDQIQMSINIDKLTDQMDQSVYREFDKPDMADIITTTPEVLANEEIIYKSTLVLRNEKTKRKAPADENPATTYGHCKESKNDVVDRMVEKNDKKLADVLESDDIEINPFLLNPVVKIMMSYMTIQDLKMARGVCNMWEQFSTQELQKLTSQLKNKRLGNDDTIQKFANSFQESPNKVMMSHKIVPTLETFSTQNESFLAEFEPKSIIIHIGYEEEINIYLELLKILENSSEYVNKLRIDGQLQPKEVDFILKWPENLKFPKLEELEIGNIGYCSYGLDDLQLIVKNIINNSPKLSILSFDEPSTDYPLSDLLSSNNNLLIQNFKNLKLFYLKTYDSELIFPQDLLQMAQAGLRLSKFKIIISLECFDPEIVLSHLTKLQEFLKIQSDTLVSLHISIQFDEGFDDPDYCKFFTMPRLPILKELYIGRYGQEDYISFNQIDLPLIVPNLKEITIGVDTDSCNLSKIFKGSLDSVEKAIINHFTLKNYSTYKHLGKFFPNVVEFKVDHIVYNYNHKYDSEWNEKYKLIPWKNTLKKLTLSSPTLEYLNFDSFSHLKELSHLELIKGDETDGDPEDDLNVDFKSLSKTNVKSIKIRNYEIHEEQLNEIRTRFPLEYIPWSITNLF